jgi:hypothetical protein
VIALVLEYLRKELGESEIAEQLKLKYISHAPEWVMINNALLKLGLVKVIKSFVQMDKKIKDYYMEREEEAEDEESEKEE